MSAAFREHRDLYLTYLRPQWRPAALLAVLLLGGIALQLLNPQILRGFVDQARAGAPLETLTLAAAAFIGVALAGHALAVVATYYSEEVGWTATNLLRADLALHVLRLDLPFHNARTPGELIERIDGDVTHLSTFFSQFVIRVLGNAILLAGVLAMLFREDWRAGAAFTAFTVAALAALRRTHAMAVPHWKESRRASAVLLGFIEERLAGIEDIRSSGAGGHAMRRLYQAMREHLRATRRAWLGGQVMWGSTIAIFALGNALAFAVGASLVAAGAITVGTVFLLFAYTELLRQPIEQITRQMQELQRATASIGRTGDLLRLRSRIADGPGRPLPPGPPAVEFAGVDFGYDDGLVLRGVSFRLAPGATLGVLGRTGSGKTTVARLLARLYDPGAGSVRLGGADLRDLRLADLRRRVAMVTQDVLLFHGTLRDNLTLFDRAVPDDRIEAALGEVGLDAWRHALPDGLDTALDSGGGGLSAGEAQLLAFCRVLLRDPGVVILDEASSRLDPATEQRLARALERLLRGRTAIVIAHRLQTVQRVDEILILDDGRVVEHGPREALGRDGRSRFAHLLRTGLEEVLA